MPPAVRDHKTAAGSTTATVTGLAVGNTDSIIAVVMTSGGGTINTMPTGFSAVTGGVQAVSGLANLRTFRKIATVDDLSGTASYAWTDNSGSNLAVIMVSCSGTEVDGASLVNVILGNGTSSTNFAINAPSATATIANGLVLRFAASASGNVGSGGSTWETGATKLKEVNVSAIGPISSAADNALVSNAATGTRLCTFDTFSSTLQGALTIVLTPVAVTPYGAVYGYDYSGTAVQRADNGLVATGLTNNVVYRTRIRARNAAGWGPYSAYSSNFTPVPAGNFMLISSSRLATLPMTGTPYTTMKAAADSAIATLDLTEPASAASPWLANYDGKGADTLAAALVYARDPTLTAYKTFVENVCRFIIGSEEEASTLTSPDTTASGDRLLAMMRQLPAYIMAADLVGMSPTITGSRAGWTTTAWNTWLGSLRTKTVGTHVSRTSIVVTNDMAHNWGTWASASRIAIDLYLNDATDLALAVHRLKLWLGEVFTGTAWLTSSEYDATWKCLPAGLTVEFIPVNPNDCGLAKDGIIVEDAGRSATTYPTWDNDGIDYSYHALIAQLNAAVLLDRRGYDVWNWGNKAFKRAMDRLVRLSSAGEMNNAAIATGNGRESARPTPWIIKYFYGGSYATLATNAEPQSLSWTDWLYA